MGNPIFILMAAAIGVWLLSWRKPDDIVWSWPWKSFCFGYTIQGYFFNASATTICIGNLTLRWHK